MLVARYPWLELAAGDAGLPAAAEGFFSVGTERRTDRNP